jgi:hypothetical protein
MVVKPKQKQIGDLNQLIETENLEFAKKAKTKKALEVALADKATAEQQWQGIMDRQMSHVSVKDKHTAIFALWKEFQTYEPDLTRDLNADPEVRFNGGLSFPWIGWQQVDQSSVGRREFPQNFPMHFSNFPKLLEWLQNLDKLPRIIQLAEGITITATPTSGAYGGIDAPLSGVVYIDYPDALSAAAPAAGGPGGGMRRAGMRRAGGLGGR